MQPKKRIQNLYGEFDKHSPFKDNRECHGCPMLCSRKRNARWLLDDEIYHLKYLPPISKTLGAYFFEEGSCTFHNGEECTIYKNRPLECRLNPLSIYEIKEELHWIIYTKCHRIKQEGTSFIKELRKLTEKIEPVLDETLLDNFRRISRAVKAFDPLVENVDFVVLKKVNYLQYGK